MGDGPGRRCDRAEPGLAAGHRAELGGVRGNGWIDAVHPDDRAAVIERWSRTLREVRPRFIHTYRLRLATGGYRHFAVDAATGTR